LDKLSQNRDLIKKNMEKEYFVTELSFLEKKEKMKFSIFSSFLEKNSPHYDIIYLFLEQNLKLFSAIWIFFYRCAAN
jgi:hypothetical protein